MSTSLPSSPSSNSIETLSLVAHHFLSQALSLLHDTVKTDEQLSRTSELSKGASVGKHLRHLADHYKALFEAVEAAERAASSPASGAPPSSDLSSSSTSSLPPLHLNYDNRTRAVAAETSHSAAISQFEDLVARLDRLTGRGGGGKGEGIEAGREVRLEAVTPVKVEVGSTFARELWFASFHAVHHFALIRVIVCGELHLSVPDDFGVAPSTLKHREESSEAAVSPSPSSPKL